MHWGSRVYSTFLCTNTKLIPISKILHYPFHPLVTPGPAMFLHVKPGHNGSACGYIPAPRWVNWMPAWEFWNWCCIDKSGPFWVAELIYEKHGRVLYYEKHGGHIFYHVDHKPEKWWKLICRDSRMKWIEMSTLTTKKSSNSVTVSCSNIFSGVQVIFSFKFNEIN